MPSTFERVVKPGVGDGGDNVRQGGQVKDVVRVVADVSQLGAFREIFMEDAGAGVSGGVREGSLDVLVPPRGEVVHHPDFVACPHQAVHQV